MIKRNKKSWAARPQFAPPPRSAPSGSGKPKATPPPADPKSRHDGWTEARKAQFCGALGEAETVEQAAARVGLSRASAYALRARDPVFAGDWDAARHAARQRLIDMAVDLAYQGRIIKTIVQGKITEERRRNSPAQVLALVKRMRSKAILGNPRVIAASRDFERCIALLEMGIAFPDPEGNEADTSDSSIAATGWPPMVQSAFCQALVQYGSVEQACVAIGKPRSMAYATRHHPAGCAFAIAWDAALLFASEHLIDLAMDLTVHGSLEQVIQDGVVVRERRTVSSRSMLDAAARLGGVLAPIIADDSATLFAGAPDFGSALDLLESGELLRRIQALDGVVDR